MKPIRLALLVTLAACGGGDSAGGGSGTVIVGMRSDFGGFNPVTSSGQYDWEVMNYALFTPLVQYDENLDVQPYLAESWELQGDTGVVFTLRQDVKWHDGHPVTAHDVLFTFELAKNEAAASPLLGSAFLPEVASAHVIDDRTIAFRFARPHAQALEDFWWPPLPRHLLQNVAAAELKNEPFNRAPVGSGPFKFGEWRANERLVLVRNPDFPAALGGPAAAERVVFRVIPEASTLLTELLTGSVHVDIPLLPDQVRQARDDAAVAVHAFPSRTVYYIGWNNAKAPFNDARVRRALAQSINRQEIVDALLHGEGELAASTIPPWHRLYPQAVEPLAYNAAQGQQALEQAGWVDRDSDGIRENAQGRKLAFTILTSDDQLRRSVVEVLQSQLRAAGADVQIRVMEFQTMRQAHVSRDFDAVFTNWVLDNFQVASAPMALLHSREAAKEGSANRSTVRIPQLDAAMQRGAAATSDDEARAAWGEVTRIVQQEQPMTFMFWLNELAAARRDVTGVEMDPRGELRSIARWAVGR
ncbi:MAG TPA: ABC transporter substrate-binding protein [Longimicrobiales bacterium]|nr:ABC transporter substrate-binding protein [Longimicrobiales bacterium]